MRANSTFSSALSNKFFYTALPSSRDPQRTPEHASGLARRPPCLKEFLEQCYHGLVGRRSKPVFIAILLAIFAGVLVFHGSVFAQAKKYYPAGTPTRAIQGLDDMLDDFIVKEKGAALTPSEDAHNRELKQKILNGTFDIRELGKLSLAKHWDAITEADRERFIGLLKDLLEEKAIFSKEQSAAKSKSGGKYFVVYRGEKFDDAGKKRAFVRTKVVIPSENIDISINYRTKKASEDWKIFDVIVDEASLVDNYRYQFDSIIKKHGFPELTNRMQKKLDDIRVKRNY